MKKIFAYMALAAAMTFAFSCNKENSEPLVETDGNINLKLSIGAPATKADRNTTEAEDKVISIDYLFYADTLSAPVYQNRVANSNGIALTDYQYTLSLKAGEDDVPDLNTLFPNGAEKIYFFAAVNTTVPSGKTLAEVRALPISTLFTEPFVMTGESELSLTPAGVAGEVDLKRLASKMIFTINVQNRVQTKTMEKDGCNEVWTPMLTGTNARVYLSNAVYKTNLGAVKGNTNANYTYPTELGQQDYSPENIKVPDGTVLPSTGVTTLVSKNVYYTYPLRWENGSDTEPYVKVIIPWEVTTTEMVKDGESQKEVITDQSHPELYYKVLLPDLQVKANCLYNVTIDITVLGTEGEPQIVIVAHASVLNWQGIGDAIDPNISDVKYLILEKEKVDFYTNSTNIYFAHSEPVSIGNISITQKDLKTGETKSIANNGYATIAADGDHLVINHALNNDLTTSNFDVSPYIFVVTLHLENDYGNRYDKTVTLTQYPALYIQDVVSNGKVFVNGQGYNQYIVREVSGGGTTTPVYDNDSSVGLPHYNYDGNYYVRATDGWYGHRGLTGQSGNIGSVGDPSRITGDLDASNDNKNQYIVKVSVLPENSSNYIGDPRFGSTTAVSNLGYETFIWGSRQGSNNNAYFTPTLTTNGNVSSQYKPGADDSQHIIAPRFMIASSYGKTTPMNYTYAKERCAAYQENGYPAGRWRLPTVAEIDFLIKMSEKDRIPSLFGPGDSGTYYAAYWAAGEYAYCGQDSPVPGIYALDFSSTGQKTATTDDGTTRTYNVTTRPTGTNYQYVASYGNGYGSSTTYQVFTRCVYDIWYWGDAPMDGSGTYIQKQEDGTYETDEEGIITGAADSWLGYKLQ